MKQIVTNETIRGYKVFNPDWTCSPNGNIKQYTCPGRFEEEGEIAICDHGMHFCENILDCFNYYQFNPKNKVAEVLAYGDIIRKKNILCTNKLEIIREIPWEEVLHMVNIGTECTGYGNTGNNNSGNWNTGAGNFGNYNVGSSNSGNYNVGSSNSGSMNAGSHNTGHSNTGHYNSGYGNTGNYNTGYENAGNCNSGFRNVGNHNSGNYNTGDWNKTSYSHGCFMTEQPKMMFFNRPSDWTYEDWQESKAYTLLNYITEYMNDIWVDEKKMSDKEKELYPSYKTNGGYLKLKEINKISIYQTWWNNLSDEDKDIIRSIPNFDPDIFTECTGIKVD